MRYIAVWFGVGIPLAAGLVWLVVSLWPTGSADLHELAGAGCGLLGLFLGGVAANWVEGEA